MAPLQNNAMKPDNEQNDHDGPNEISKNDIDVKECPGTIPDVSLTIPVEMNGEPAISDVNSNHDQNDDFTALSALIVSHPDHDNEISTEKKMSATSNNQKNCHIRLEVVVKGPPSQKPENFEEEERSKGDSQDNEKPGTKIKCPPSLGPPRDSKQIMAPPPIPKVFNGDHVPQALSRKSLRRSRAAWKAMEFPPDLEDVFTDGSDMYTDSASSLSDSDDENNLGFTSSWANFVVGEMKPEDVDDSSPSRLEWLRQKREDGEQNPYLDRLMSMIGLEEVKAHFLAIKAKVKAKADKNFDEPNLRLHLVLHGKDGIGKKSIAKLYAQFLFSIGAIKDKTFWRRLVLAPNPPPLSASPPPPIPYVPQGDCISLPPPPPRGPRLPPQPPRIPPPPPPPIKQIIPNIIFFDLSNSDRLDPGSLEYAIKKHHKSVLIFSSRRKALINSIENSEKALQELQAPLTLSDYSEDELLKLLLRMIQKRGLSIENGVANPSLRVLVKRVARRKESESFRNVHSLQDELDKACRRRALRIQKEHFAWLHSVPAEKPKSSDFLNETKQGEGGAIQPYGTTSGTAGKGDILTRQDILGPELNDIRRHNQSWKTVQDMIGLEKVKSEFGDIITYAQMNYQRELLGMDPLRINLNRLFLGPAGVGKTTVARLYGLIIAELGLVSGGTVMMRNPTDFIGVYVGHSEVKTTSVLEEARGNVLIIDDAHMLYPGSAGSFNKTDVFRIAVLDTLVAEISADPEDRCVILVGYDHEMELLFNNSNPGLQRRFPKETALRFSTYSEDELWQIMQLKAKESNFEITKDAGKVCRQVLGRMRINPKFGNAGDVENLLNQAKIRFNARHKSTDSDPITATRFILETADIDPDWDRASRADEGRSELFKGFVGFEKIVKQFENYQNLVAGLRLHGIDPRSHIPWAFIFKGPPGTGKTSTARKVGRLYYDMNLLSTDEVVTCSVTDLVGQIVGETGPKVIELLERGLGKVLFVDEAYRLQPSTGFSFHIEAIGELVDAMTKPRYSNNMVIILAGYTAEMDLLLRSNPGLRSRFPTHITFPPMDPCSCLRHLNHEVRKLNVNIQKVTDPANKKLKKVHRLFRKLSRTEGWASGRDVETLAKTVIGNVYMSQGKSGKRADLGSLEITFDELIEALECMLQERIDRQNDDTE